MSAPPDLRLRRLCSAWCGDAVVTVDPVATSGFSGSQVYRVSCRDGGTWAAKSWGSSDHDRIAWVHALARHLRGTGIDEIPQVAALRRGGTFGVDEAGVAWELVGWVEGGAVESPTVAQAAAAAACLARLHRAAAGWPACPVRHMPSPAIERRVAQAERLLAQPWQRLVAAASGARGGLASGVAARLAQAVDLFVDGQGERAIRRVASAPQLVLDAHAVLRDIWWEHVLFARHHDRVAGIVDLHAAAIDTPATDLARLLGSWVPPDNAEPGRANLWHAALSAYQAIQSPAPHDPGLVRWLDATGVVFGLDNWFRWILAESREFGQPARVVRRIEWLIGRLPAALAELADGAGLAV